MIGRADAVHPEERERDGQDTQCHQARRDQDAPLGGIAGREQADGQPAAQE